MARLSHDMNVALNSSNPPGSALKGRSRHALWAASLHLVLSAVVAGTVAMLVFWGWFPAPLHQLMGGVELFLLIASVDVTCGPLLTLVVFTPTKPRAELRRDLAVVVVVQLLALGYGIHALSYARPVALVFEVERFRAVSYADLDEAEASDAPSWAQPWSFSSPRTMGARTAANSQEMMASINASLQGVGPSQRPSWWQDYALSVPRVLDRAHPVADLYVKHPLKKTLIDAAIRKALADRQPDETADPAALLWLPLISRRVDDWVVLLDPVTARIRGYAHVDGF